MIIYAVGLLVHEIITALVTSVKLLLLTMINSAMVVFEDQWHDAVSGI